jgi:hypothetical protein
MRIPKKFKQHGRTIRVKWDKTLIQECGRVAEVSYRSDEIRLQPPSESHLRPRRKIEQSYLHEMLHHIFNESTVALKDEYAEEVRSNEAFVDLTAGLLHQALTTSKGELK